jgi:ribosomal RNA methyltransferase FmrO
MKLTNNQLSNLILNIKKNKKYSSISEDLIESEINKYFKIDPNEIKFLEHEKSKKYKEIIRNIRSKLHLIYGSFQVKHKDKREEYLIELKKHKKDSKEYYLYHEKILSTNISSKERLKDYEFVYENIFKIVKKTKTILDLGSGINLVSYPYMKIDDVTYYSYDIDEKDIDFLNEYLVYMKKNSKLKGKSGIIDLRKELSVKKLPKADLVFMFKVVDPIDSRKNHKLSEQIIKSLNCKYIVCSFSTKTVTGKRMNHPYRGWFEQMINRISYNFSKFEIDNEVFYIIEK